MIRDTYENILQQKDVRQNLITLKTELKDERNRDALLYRIGTDYSVFDRLLENEDAKIRKNAALVMGELAVPCFLDKLYAAYQKEEQLFVRSSYLTAMKKLDYSAFLPDLKRRLSVLTEAETEDASRKHMREEARILSELILAKEGIQHHPFTGYQVPSVLVLMTNRNYKNVTREQLEGITSREFNAGVMIKTSDLRKVLSIRTYSELLFILEDLKVCRADADAAGKAIADSSLIRFIEERHAGEAPFYFRIELKSKLPLDKKSAFTKKLAFEIENLTNRRLINSTTNYEFEIRLIENKEGLYNVLIKLYTLKDERFAYRKSSIAAGIQPSNAALMAALARDYLEEGAQVLDPFCGTGTMLIERNLLVRAGTMYGLDIYGDAINKARENSNYANVNVNYINRDFFDFKHDYLFDEIFTDMPRATGQKEEDGIYNLYRNFFLKASLHLKENGIIILYSHNRDYVKKLLDRRCYKLEQEYEISKKEGAYLFIIKYIKLQ